MVSLSEKQASIENKRKRIEKLKELPRNYKALSKDIETLNRFRNTFSRVLDEYTEAEALPSLRRMAIPETLPFDECAEKDSEKEFLTCVSKELPEFKDVERYEDIGRAMKACLETIPKMIDEEIKDYETDLESEKDRLAKLRSGREKFIEAAE